jgi:hypothetical protein
LRAPAAPLFLLLVTLLLPAGVAAAQDEPPLPSWKPVPGRIMTRWAPQVTPENPHPEYPRPQMIRERWRSLNGLWDFVIQGGAEGEVRQILVPFPIESALSGVGFPLDPEQQIAYRRRFRIPAEWSGQRIRLHFGAVDWSASVRVNGQFIGEHTGGYDPFWFDITDALTPGENTLLVIVADPTDAGGQPRGKQIRKPEGIWYTRSSGIWQTVWLEPVPEAAINHYLATPRLTEGAVEIFANCSKTMGLEIRAEVTAGGAPVASLTGPANGPLKLGIPKVRVWSPDDPFLYDLRLTLLSDGQPVDSITGYLGMRDIRVGPDEHGTTRILLNGKPLFQFGPLDQGFWPDGLYTPPTDEALRSDIDLAKRLGCNMLRKHVKVESDRFYTWCDRLGILVWQDIPSANNPAEARAGFESETARIITALGNHPSIVMWVPFNEGWGQYDTPRIVDRVRELDPTRLVNNASGWTDARCGDIIDIHAYPGPATPWPEAARAAVLGEFGGLGLPLPGHLWVEKDNWGYVSFKNQAELTDAYLSLLDKLHPLITQGLSAAVYTQTTDVEIEVNGWLTYDREVLKIDADRAAAAAKEFCKPHGAMAVIVPAAPQQAVRWRHTFTEPDGAWTDSAFDDSSWDVGAGGFGSPGTPGAVIGTEWITGDIWLRRTIVLPQGALKFPHLLIHHDEDASVYLNGTLIAELKGYTTAYTLLALDEKARAALRPGDNLLAIRCRQTRGGQYIDAGLADMTPATR